jgi:nitroreductase
MNDDASPAREERDLFHARYGREVGPLPSNAVIDAMLAHRSCRAFKPDALPDGALESIVAAAQSAATSSNMQGWSVVAVESAERRQKLFDLADNQKQILEAPLTLCFVADLSRLACVADAIPHPREGLDYFESFLVAAIDSALAAQNACLAAESMGFGTCYLGVLRHEPEKVAALLELPSMAMVTFGLSIAWPDEARPTFIKPRLPQKSVLHRESYKPDQAVAPVGDYELALDQFNRMVRNGQPLWGLRSASRVATPEALNGRQHLMATLRRMGFALK